MQTRSLCLPPKPDEYGHRPGLVALPRPPHLALAQTTSQRIPSQDQHHICSEETKMCNTWVNKDNHAYPTPAIFPVSSTTIPTVLVSLAFIIARLRIADPLRDRSPLEHTWTTWEAPRMRNLPIIVAILVPGNGFVHYRLRTNGL